MCTPSEVSPLSSQSARSPTTCVSPLSWAPPPVGGARMGFIPKWAHFRILRPGGWSSYDLASGASGRFSWSDRWLAIVPTLSFMLSSWHLQDRSPALILPALLRAELFPPSWHLGPCRPPPWTSQCRVPPHTQVFPQSLPSAASQNWAYDIVMPQPMTKKCPRSYNAASSTLRKGDMSLQSWKPLSIAWSSCGYQRTLETAGQHCGCGPLVPSRSPGRSQPACTDFLS